MDTLPIINSTYIVLKDLIDLNGHLDKKWRYSLGQGTEATLTSVLENLILAKNAPKALKAPYLLRASSFHELTILKLRLYLEFNCANETRIFQLQARLAEIGKMLGGWLKSLHTLPQR